MYKVTKAVVKKEVLCCTLEDVKMLFNRLDFFCAVFCGYQYTPKNPGNNAYKFYVYSNYNNKPTNDIIERDAEQNAFITFEQFKEYIDTWLN